MDFILFKIIDKQEKEMEFVFGEIENIVFEVRHNYSYVVPQRWIEML